jgi:hypothetical protein
LDRLFFLRDHRAGEREEEPHDVDRPARLGRAGLTLLASSMRGVIALRLAGIASNNVAFCRLWLREGLYPVVVLHLMLLPASPSLLRDSPHRVIAKKKQWRLLSSESTTLSSFYILFSEDVPIPSSGAFL